jgi:hypothetical protein
MAWYWLALVLGVIAPWLVMGGHIRMAFREGGLQTGLGTWFGISLITVPMVFLIMWLGRFFIR